jgi:hypothetical protein
MANLTFTATSDEFDLLWKAFAPGVLISKCSGGEA